MISIPTWLFVIMCLPFGAIALMLLYSIAWLVIKLIKKGKEK